MDPTRLKTLCGNLAELILEDEMYPENHDTDTSLTEAIEAAITEWLKENPVPDEDEDEGEGDSDSDPDPE